MRKEGKNQKFVSKKNTELTTQRIQTRTELSSGATENTEAKNQTETSFPQKQLAAITSKYTGKSCWKLQYRIGSAQIQITRTGKRNGPKQPVSMRSGSPNNVNHWKEIQIAEYAETSTRTNYNRTTVQDSVQKRQLRWPSLVAEDIRLQWQEKWRNRSSTKEPKETERTENMKECERNQEN